MRKVAIAFLMMVILFAPALTQSKQAASELPKDFIGFKARFYDGTKEPAIKMSYSLRYRVMTDENLNSLLSILKSSDNYPLINVPVPNEYGWDIEIQDGSKASLDQADKFVNDFGLLIGKKGLIFSLPDRIEYYDLFYYGPRPKLISDRKVLSNGQNTILLRVKPGDTRKLKNLIEEVGFISGAPYQLVGNTFYINKANAYTWDEIIPRIAKALE